MALPGVRTVLKDRFYTLSRTDIPNGTPRVVAIARRGLTNDATPVDAGTAANYNPVTPRSEKDVIDSFGEGSELHRAYQELVAGGAALISLVGLPGDTTDSQIATSGSGVLDLAFGAAEIIQPDIIVPWGRGAHSTDWEAPATPSNDLPLGFHADRAGLAKQVADKLAGITDRTNPVFGVMGIAPQLGETEDVVPADLTTHFAVPNLPDRETNMGDNGSFLSVIATELVPTSYPKDGSWGYSNGAALYAGFLSSLVGENASTGRILFNVNKMRYNPTRTQQENLIAKGLVPVGQNYNRNAVVVDGLTFGKSTSDYLRLTTLRIVFDAVKLVRVISQPYIGMPAKLENRNSLETAISSALRSMMIGGALLDADFVVTYVGRENKAIIDLVLRPAFEIRNIEISVSVQL